MITPAAVDIHTHAIASVLPDLSRKYPYNRWPSVTRTSDRTAEIRVGGRHFRDVDDRCWSPSRRLEDMDEGGVAVQVLSPVPITLCHHAPADGAVELAQFQNDFLAGMVLEAPTRFRALGAIPLQDPAAAVVELRRCVLELGFLGVEIGTSCSGSELGESSFEPFFVEAAELGALVFVHPDEICGGDRLDPWGLRFGVGIPVETAVAAATLISSGLPARLDNLRICLAHGGGALAMILPRIERGWDLPGALEGRRPARAADLGNFYVDSLTYDTASLALALERFGEDHIMLGTDYPFAAREDPPDRVLAGTGRFGPEIVEAIRVRNATGLPRWNGKQVAAEGPGSGAGNG